MRTRIHRPRQWEKATPGVLIALAGTMLFLTGFGAFKTISLFKYALPEPPMAYWIDVSFWTLVVAFCTAVWALAWAWISGTFASPKTWAVASIVASIAGYAIVTAWDTSNGVAIYRDRIVYRDGGWASPIVTVPLSSLQELQSSCIWRDGRAEAAWKLVLRNGKTVRLDSGGPGGLGAYEMPTWISVMRLLDGRSDEAGVWRQSMLHASTGQPLRDPECEAEVSSKYNLRDQAFVRSLFRRSPGAV